MGSDGKIRDRITMLLTYSIVGLLLLAAIGGILVWLDVTSLDDVEGVFGVIGTVFCFVGPIFTAILGYYFRNPA